MRKTITITLLVICTRSLVHACVWDYDTLAQEIAGIPEVKVVIAGGFVRNPPLYYTMRIERLKNVIADNPDDLDAYDGIAVANDRIGNSDRAVQWMQKKKEALERLNYDAAKHPQPNHRYRYYANLGTFYAHGSIKSTDIEDKLAKMKMAAHYIAKAIKDNPDAHFGREKYQLMAINWIVGLYENQRETELNDNNFPELLGLANNQYPDKSYGYLKEIGLEDAYEGLSGLIIMGAAWESVDVFYSLSKALQAEGKSSVAYMAYLRIQELIDAGRGSIVPNAPAGDELKKILSKGDLAWDKDGILQEYNKLKAQANQWHDKRTAYLLTNLKQDRHPDTDTDFWDDFNSDPSQVKLRVSPFAGLLGSSALFILFIGLCVILGIAAVSSIIIRSIRKKVKKSTSTPIQHNETAE